MHACVTAAIFATLFAQPGAESPKAPAPAVAPAATGPYKVLDTFKVAREGSWDSRRVDSDARRLYVPRGTRVVVLNSETGSTIGEIAETQGVHDVALATE